MRALCRDLLRRQSKNERDREREGRTIEIEGKERERERGIDYVFFSRNIKVGDPTDSNNMLGALISKEHLAKVNEQHQITYRAYLHILAAFLKAST